MRFVALLLLVALALAPAGKLCADSQPLWTNPLVEQRADGFVYRHTDGYYYFMATVPNWDYLELRRATTLDGLRDAEPKTIWNRHPSGPMGGFIWAPEIHFIGGKWFIYFGAGTSEDNWKIRLYVLENDSDNPLEGDWNEKGQIDTGMDSFALDPTTFEQDGQQYLVWAQKDPKMKSDVHSNIYIAKMDTPWSISGSAVMLSTPKYPWECVRCKVNEGPEVLQKNGKIFITYSASGIGSEYCLGLLTADAKADLLDPQSWVKSPVPVFKSSPENSQYGPGHNAFTSLPDGTDVMMYHDRNYEVKGDPLNDKNRHERAQIVNWKADGTPDFGVPVPDGPYSPGVPAPSSGNK
jgi:GH43 family beta-xylosidase